MDMSIMQLFPVEPGMAAATPQNQGAGPMHGGGLNFATLFASLQGQWPYPLDENAMAFSETNTPESTLALPVPEHAVDGDAPDSDATHAVVSAPPSWAAMPLVPVVDAGTVTELANATPDDAMDNAVAAPRELTSHPRIFSSAALMRQPAAQPESAAEEVSEPSLVSLKSPPASMPAENTGHSEAFFRVLPAAANAVTQKFGDTGVHANAPVIRDPQATAPAISAQSNAVNTETSNAPMEVASPLPVFVLTPSAAPEPPANAAAVSAIAATEAKPLVRVTDLPPPVMAAPVSSDDAANAESQPVVSAEAAISRATEAAPSPQPEQASLPANENKMLARADNPARNTQEEPVASAMETRGFALEQPGEPVDTVDTAARAPMLRSALAPDTPRMSAPAPEIAQESAVSGVSPKADTPVATSVQPQTVPLRPHAPEGAESIAGQAIKSVRYLAARDGEQRMTVRLVPESLGEMRVELRAQDGELSVRIVSANPMVRETMQAQVHELRQSLSREGIEVGKVDVAASMSQNTDTGGRHPQETAHQAFRAASFSRTDYGYARTAAAVSPRSHARTHDGALNVFV